MLLVLTSSTVPYTLLVLFIARGKHAGVHTTAAVGTVYSPLPRTASDTRRFFALLFFHRSSYRRPLNPFARAKSTIIAITYIHFPFLAGQLQNDSLAQDAGLVSLARALLRRAAGVANNHPVRNGRSSHEWHNSRPPPPPPPTSCNPWKGPPVLPPSFSFRGKNEGGGRSPAELPRHDVESRDDPLTRKSEDNLTITTPLPPAPPSAPLPTPPLTPPAPVATTAASARSSPDAPPLLAGEGGAPNTVRLCLNPVVAGKGAPAAAAAMVGAAKKMCLVQTGDRARAVGGIATWPRNKGGPSPQPKPHLNTPPFSSKRVDFHCHNGKNGALVLEEEPPRPPAGDDVGPRDETRVGGGGYSVTLSARGAQTVTVCLSQCSCRRFDGKQAVDTTAAAAAAAASACSIRQAVDGSRGEIDGDIDRALSSKLFTRPAESKDKRPSTLYRSEEEVHHQELRRVPPVYPRPQISTHFCQAPSPRPTPSPQALPTAGIACSPQINKSFREKPRGKIGPRQKPHPARSCIFGAGAKTTCEDERNIAPPISVLGPMGSYTNDPRGGEGLSYDDSRVCMQPSSVNFLARKNVCSPRIEYDGGDAGRCPCCHRFGNGYQNEQHITGAKQWQPEKADSSHTASPSGTTTTQEAAEHPAGYRRRYGRRDDSEETRQRYASGETKTEREPLQSADSNTDRRNKEASPTRRRLPSAGSTESDAETAGMAEAREDDSSSCALARKRALMRVRLARQRNSQAAAVADANERGFRVERRRRREKRLAVLLLKTFGGDVVDGSRHVERRPLSSQDDKNDSEGGGGGGESGSSPTGMRCSSK